jgi:poly(hydroxyalkanoate) depolymerase family esterase
MRSGVVLLVIIFLSVSLAHAGTITRVENFGSNPGAIKMFKYVPENMPANAPLVVSLHGCTQDAETYSNAGWMQLADRWKFYVLFPEQSTANNLYRCWNWFQPVDISRDRGEVKSIVAMIDTMKSDHSINERKIYVEGLSAGGWMVAALLASYPDVFAAGATNAGGPAYCASTLSEARRCLTGTDKSPDNWRELVRNKGYGEYSGRWPRISIWHGSKDTTVFPLNQQELVDQWTSLHKIDQKPDKQERVGQIVQAVHREYHDDKGQVLVETYLIPNMGHGTPIASEPKKICGKAGPYILNEGICAVRHIGLFWGLDKWQSEEGTQ